MIKDNKKITICACSSREFLPKLKVAQAATELRRAGYEVEIVADLCELAITQPERMAEIAQTTVVGCHARAMKSLFESAGAEARSLVDLRANSVGEALIGLGIESEELLQSDEEILQQMESFECKVGTDAWYPVLDREKCVNCGKCHDFCLFGVYSLEDGQVKVAQPLNCKNNCPACARVCPVGAVIFAKHPEAPINGGEAAAQAEGTTFKIDMNAVYNEALRERLQHRRASVLLRKEGKR
jgi:NAD-dependent dihydropyrimidine dehydrogenase PreA subunit